MLLLFVKRQRLGLRRRLSFLGVPMPRMINLHKETRSDNAPAPRSKVSCRRIEKSVTVPLSHARPTRSILYVKVRCARRIVLWTQLPIDSPCDEGRSVEQVAGRCSSDSQPARLNIAGPNSRVRSQMNDFLLCGASETYVAIPMRMHARFRCDVEVIRIVKSQLIRNKKSSLQRVAVSHADVTPRGSEPQRRWVN